MAGINGAVEWQIQPLGSSNSNLGGSFWGDTYNYLKSVNDPLRYQVLWTSAGVTEGQEPSAGNFSGLPTSTTVGNGDVVNIIFKVETSVGDGYWQELGSIKKSRDIANKKYDDGSQPNGHRFTVDVSQLVSNELSYSLCPINKGTWQSNYYGGMNGGLTMQDNVLSGTGAMGDPISRYNVSRNGTYRLLKVTVNYEIINGDGNIVSAGNGSSSNTITVINSVNQFEKDSLFYNASYTMGDSSSNKYNFLSRCLNSTDSSPLTYDFQKPIRIDEQAEYLQFYIRKAWSVDIGGAGSDYVGAIGLYVETFLADGTAENDFYIRDFEDNLITEIDNNSDLRITEYQQQMFIQNISPYYINNTAALKNPSDYVATTFPYWTAYTGNKITASTSYYRVSMSRFAMYGGQQERRTTKFRYYTIDREDEKNAYGFVRFHWLNSVGGIDSYTAKRDVVEGLTISRDVIERKSGDRTWYQGNEDNGSTIQPSLYHSDTMRGGDIYKGGREVFNVNAERVQSVYTEPLNKSVAKWLEEMMLSPNVWIEMDTEATQMGNLRNDDLRPSDKEYIPVIITNSDIETVNQENGLVKFNIEYTLAHKVITQRN
jgi:hypothetical protein